MAQTKGEFDPPLLTLERVLPVATVIYAASVGGPGIVNVDASKAHRTRYGSCPPVARELISCRPVGNYLPQQQAAWGSCRCGRRTRREAQAALQHVVQQLDVLRTRDADDLTGRS
jgi:hypothetical protein